MILVLRALGVGDLATAVPALRGLRRAFPGRELALAVPAWLTPLVELIGGIDRIVPADGLHDACLPTRPDIAVDLHGRGPQSHRLLRATHPGRLWAFANPDAGHADGPPWAEEEHEIARWCRLVDHYGVAADPDDVELAVPPPPGPDRGGLTIIHPGAKSPSRRWPPDRFASVARRLVAQGHRVVVTGSTAERHIAVRVAERSGLAGDAVLAGRTDLACLAGVVARARLVISGDTGVAHLATAYRRPSVILFGPMSPARWGPPDRPYHQVIWHGHTAEPGDGPGPDAHPALLAIGVDEVMAAATSVPMLAAWRR